MFSIFHVTSSNYLTKVPGDIYSDFTFCSLISDIQVKKYYVTDFLTKLVNIPKATVTKIRIPRRKRKKLLELIAKNTYPVND